MKQRNFVLFPTNWGLLVLLLAITSSCRSPKELTYLNDLNGREQLTGAPRPMPLYRIRKKDNLYISILTSNPDLNKLYNPAQAGKNSSDNNQYDNIAEQYINGNEVNADGDVELPIIGKINVEGKTIAESQIEIEQRANSFLKDATAKVKLLNFRVTVIGEVKTPGVYYTYNNNFSVLDAIGTANGNTDFADLAKVMVLRPSEGGSVTYTLNLKSKQALSSEGYWLQPNDKIFIPPAPNKNSQLHISTAALVLSTITSVFLILNYIKK